MRTFVFVVPLAVVASGVAVAQEPPAAPSPPPPSPGAPPPASQPPGAPPAGASPPPADDLGELEAALAADQATAAAAQPVGPPPATGSNPDLSLIADFALAYFSDESLPGGGHDPTVTGFNLQGVELALQSVVDPYFRFDANLVFGPDGFELEEAFATTLALPANLQARVGQFLTRFGRLNPTHQHAWAFSDRPFQLSRVFGGDGNRNLGAELSYLTPLPWYVELVGSVTDARGETARSFLDDSERTVSSPLDFQATLALEQFVPFGDDWSLLGGLSLATGPNASGAHERTDVYGVDLYLKYRPISRPSETEVALQAEWLYRRRDVLGALLADHGGYAYLTWQLVRRWQTGLRYEYGAAATDVHDRLALDPLDPAWTEARHRVAGQLTFKPTEFSRLRAQASLDRPAWLADPIVAGFLTAEFSIGAHASHPF